MYNRIGEILMEEKLINQDELTLCLEYKKINPEEHLGSILRYHGFINDHQLASSLSKQIQWKNFDREYIPDFEAIDKVGLDYFSKNQIFPLKNGSTPSFVVSFVDNVEVTDFLKDSFGNEGINFYIGAECDVRNALDLIVLEQKRHELLSEIETLKSEGIDSIASWLNGMINLAIITRSTDIHIEPTEKTTNIRFRIDGILSPITCIKKNFISKIANIILNKCKGNPCDFTIQDGRFYHEFPEMAKVVDVRFSQIPNIYGPGIVLRLLDKDRASIPLESLGYSLQNRELIDQAIITPHGLVLVTGPTGSGKSTTLAAILNQIKSIGKKILTIEDPVEITHSLMSQVEVDLAHHMTFGAAIRAFLRHDPDALFVGEIRDKETAEEAFRAANTGLQVFSTLHTNNPISAILRLKDLGVETDKISSSLVGVISQRLVRKLCPHCKTPRRITKADLKLYQAKYLTEDVQSTFEAVGCSRCRNGYLGRTVVAEVLIITPDIREIIGRNALGEIYSLIRNQGTYRTMVNDMQSLVLKGDTSIEEAVRILG